MEVSQDETRILDTCVYEDECKIKEETKFEFHAVDDMKVDSHDITEEKHTATVNFPTLEMETKEPTDNDSKEFKLVELSTENPEKFINEDLCVDSNGNSNAAENCENSVFTSNVNASKGSDASDENDGIVVNNEDVIFISDDDSEDDDKDEVKDPNEEPLVYYSDLVPEPHCSKCMKNKLHESCNCECHMRCGVCQKLFNNKHHLKIHSLLHYGKQKVLIKEKTIQPKKKTVQPKKKAVQPKKNQTLNPAPIQRSRLYTNNEDLYVCSKCESAFVRESSYLCHKKIHDLYKLYKCEMCNESYKLKRDFSQHMLVYHYVQEKSKYKSVTTKEKIIVHQCDVCDKHFRLITDLRKHAKSHGKPKRKPYTRKASNKQSYQHNATDISSSYSLLSDNYYPLDDEIDISENKICLDDLCLEAKPYPEVLNLINKEIFSENHVIENTVPVGSHFMSNNISSEDSVTIKEEVILEEEKKPIIDYCVVSNDCSHAEDISLKYQEKNRQKIHSHVKGEDSLETKCDIKNDFSMSATSRNEFSKDISHYNNENQACESSLFSNNKLECTNDEVHECDMCDKSFDKRSDLFKHSYIHNHMNRILTGFPRVNKAKKLAP